MTRQRPEFSVSLMCMDLLRAGGQLTVLNRRADAYHVDIMDGHFARNFALSPDFVKAAREFGALPMDMHLMTEHPNDWIDVLAENGATTISVHAETVNRDAFRVLDRIRSHGCRTGVVLNPATPLAEVRSYLGRVDLLTIMTVDVGYAGQPFIPEMLGKIEEAANLKRDEGLSFAVQVDGSCNARTFGRLWDAGTEVFILGTSGLFGLDPDLDVAWDRMAGSFAAATSVAL
jgi:D-allulose-6-phosphate 3-epimerase